MDTNIGVAIITGGFSSLVGIAALFLTTKRMDDIRQDVNSLRDEIRGELGSLRSAIDILTGATHELDKRLSIIEDRIFRKD